MHVPALAREVKRRGQADSAAASGNQND